MKKLFTFLLIIILCFSLSLQAEAAVKVTRKGSILTVKDNNKTLFTTTYKQETVYTTSGVNARKGPSLNYGVNRIITKGSKLTRIGVHKGSYKFDIILINGKIYFVHSQYLTKNRPPINTTTLYTPDRFKLLGVINWGGWRWTWYSQRVLPGGGLKIPGRHVENKYVCDSNGYICLASVDLSKGTVVNTPFGKKGKVYDTGCPRGTLDVYTDF